ncbi:hypothetical protein ASC68_27170 [Devosia sp. Root105]|nr:hypothetical protein ASC68_27170 [Devosia sp. Root105]
MAGPWENYGPHVAEPAVPPAGLKTGTQGYLDWAIEQSKAGRTLPKLSLEEMLPAGATLVPGWETPGAGELLSVGPLAIPPGITDMIRSLYPFERNTKTGEYRPAIPKIVPGMIEGIVDAVTLPRDVADGMYGDLGTPYSYSPELAGRVFNLATLGVTGPMPKLGPGRLPRLRQEAATLEADGFGIPLTSGQASGDLHQLRSEQLLRQADASQPLMRTFDDRQTEAIGAATGTIGKEFGGAADDLSGTVTIGLQNKTKLAKEDADAFFEVAQDGKLKVRLAAVKALPGFVKQRLSGVVVDDTLTPAAATALREIEGATLVPSGRRSPLSWSELEKVRRKLAGLSGTGPDDITATRGVKQAFDDWLSDALDQQLFSGDEAALEALNAARAESVRYLSITNPKGGDAAGATIAKMQQGNASAEQVANWLYGADMVSPNLAATDVARRLKAVLGPASEEWKSVRASAWNKLVHDPATGEARVPAVLTKRLDDFLANKDSSLASTLFSEEERNRMKALSAVLKRTVLPLEARNPSRSFFGLGDTVRDVTAAVISGLVGAKFGGEIAGIAPEVPGILAAAAVPIFSRVTREAEARAAIANKLPPKPMSDALLHAPSLAARVAAITAERENDMDLRRLAQQMVQGVAQPQVDNDLARALGSIGVRYDPHASSEVDRATHPQPFLPPWMRLTQPEPDPLFQLHA